MYLSLIGWSMLALVMVIGVASSDLTGWLLVGSVTFWKVSLGVLPLASSAARSMAGTAYWLAGL